MGAGPDVRWDGGRQSRTDTAPRADRPCPAGPRARSVRGGSRPGVFHALGGLPDRGQGAARGFRPGGRQVGRCPWPVAREPPGLLPARASGPVAREPPGVSGPWAGGTGSGPVAREPPGAFHTRARASGPWPGSRPGFQARGRAVRVPGPWPASDPGVSGPWAARASALMAGEPPSFSGPYPGRGTSLAAPGSRPGLLAVREGPGPARRGTGSTGRLSSRASAGQIRGTAAAARRRPGHKPSRDHLQ